jgi:hypothetical protein
MSGGRIQMPDASEFYKTYPDAEIIPLPEPDLSSQPTETLTFKLY